MSAWIGTDQYLDYFNHPDSNLQGGVGLLCTSRAPLGYADNFFVRLLLLCPLGLSPVHSQRVSFQIALAVAILSLSLVAFGLSGQLSNVLLKTLHIWSLVGSSVGWLVSTLSHWHGYSVLTVSSRYHVFSSLCLSR